MKTIDIFEYVALNNPKGVETLLVSKGFAVPQSWNKYTNEQQLTVIANALDVVAKSDEDSKMQFLSMHPDLKILDTYLTRKNASKFLSADGEEKTAPNKQNETDPDEKPSFMATKTTNVLMGAGIAVLSVIILKQLI